VYFEKPGCGFSGGRVGDAYAKVLCPVGFVREHHVQYAARGDHRYVLDFAHIEGKVNIELDGPFHNFSQNEVRDSRLRDLGWKIIRIRHRRGEV
jgi:very-short-patch-repair endonuclease